MRIRPSVFVLALVVAPITGCWLIAGTPDFEAQTEAGGGGAGGGGASAGGGGPDGGAGAGVGVGGEACTTLVDDFNDQTIDPAKWNIVLENGVAEETEQGRLHISGTSGNGATIETNGPVSIEQCFLFVEMIPALHDGSVVLLLTNAAGSPRVLVEVRGDDLHFGLDNEPPQKVGTYDPVADRWWRLGNEDNTFVFYTSDDGQSWTYRSAAAVPFELDPSAIYVRLGTYGALGATDVEYDHLNTMN